MTQYNKFNGKELENTSRTEFRIEKVIDEKR